MNANDMTRGRIFFRQCVSVYALCATMALPALGQGAGNSGKASAPPKAHEGQDVKVSDYGTVDISVKDTDLATVLEMLALESKKNIITSKGVSATVSANLYDVTFQEALKAILDVNGYTYYEEGNFIYVITKEEAAALAKARRKSESRVFELNYLSPTDAKESITPLLSEAGKASVRGAVMPGMKPEIANNGADDYAFTPRLVVNDYPENLAAIGELLANLDTPPQQVLVEATILQTALDEANAFGVDFTVLGSLNFTDLTSPLAAVNNLLAGANPTNGVQPSDNNAQAASSTVGNTTGPGGLKVGIMSDDISVFLRVLDEVTDTTVLARPKLMALNRQRAEVLVGVKVGYLSTTSTETATTQNVQFLDTGIQLIFRPFIANDGSVRMELKPRVSEARLRDVTDATGSIVTIPDELTNELTTNVRTKDGQTIVLGGLFRDSTKTTRRQVPWLGDIPIVGAAFRGQDDKVERSEVIFLITPSIVKDATMFALGQSQLDYAETLRVGGRANLLPFSREKVTDNYNQKAQEAYNKGDKEKALYYVNNSLSLAPTQPEMIKLREQITGERAKGHERDIQERTFRKEIGEVAPAAPTASATSSATTPETTTAAASTSASSNVETSTSTVPAEGAASAGTSTDSANSTTGVQASATSSSNESSESTTASGESVATVTETEQTTAPQTASTTDAPNSSQSDSQSSDSTSASPTEITQQTSDPAPMDNSSANAGNESSMTPEQWMFYQQFLYNYFMALELPELAANFVCEEDQQYASGFPFEFFFKPNTVAGVTDSSNPED